MYDTACRRRQFESLEPVVDGFDDGEQREQHAQMNTCTLRHPLLGCLNPNRAVQEVDHRRHERHEDERGERPIDGVGEEREPEHVETDIDLEERIFDSERLRIAEQQPFLPLTDGRKADHDPGHDRDHEAQKP